MKMMARHERVLSAIESTNRVLYQNETNKTIPNEKRKKKEDDENNLRCDMFYSRSF